MKMLRLKIALLVTVILASCSLSKNTSNKSTVIEFKINAQGDFSRVTKKSTYVVRNKNEQTIRNKNEQTIKSLDEFNIDAIDFKTTMLAEIFIGEKPSSGYKVILDTIIETDDSITIKYHIDKPEGIVMTVMTSPYIIIEIPQSSKEVIFSEDL
ncbi:protease complex subunit PrcB family protein [Saccharicrinis aurantiacus]|uniref:protease complex subunit PrcB family protein n=1 Tax=Saccharicrinis aurantiacus TaxID=1849719 RepID=UPI002490993B|nr:protease complex subunit PrcB family protein [Saccharicrinis aurantiacus]